jgi:hypothetical protein
VPKLVAADAQSLGFSAKEKAAFDRQAWRHGGASPEKSRSSAHLKECVDAADGSRVQLDSMDRRIRAAHPIIHLSSVHQGIGSVRRIWTMHAGRINSQVSY